MISQLLRGLDSNTKWAVKALLHVGALFVAFLLAYELRRALPIEWWFTDPDATRVLRWAALFAAFGGLVELVFQTERSAWRFASMHEVVGIVRNVTIATGIFLAAIFIMDRGVELPRSVLPLAWVLGIIALVGIRLMWRLRHDREPLRQLLPRWFGKDAARGAPLLIVGSMEAADQQLRHIRADAASTYRPIGVISLDPKDIGVRIHGVPVLDTVDRWRPGRLESGRGGAPAILFVDDPVRTIGLTPGQIGELRKGGHVLLRPQSMGELGADVSVRDALKEIPLEEFLPRKPIDLDPEPVRALVAGKRVLVTGAGGSIGSEIARQLVAFGCAHLTLVDHSEFLLFEIDRELSGLRAQPGRSAVLANVRDEARMAEVFRTERPDIVFHAAALKHVALVENNPAEGVLTNVLGTWNVVAGAVAAGAEQVVLISTDKAVAPTSMMGSTKRIAEALMELVAPGSTRLAVVRFGNVLGSAGSVVPIFRDQIAAGGPVTITHPDVERYFMTIPEAVQLVLHAASLNARAPQRNVGKYVLEMGQPVKIIELARQMIQLSGKTPDVDIEIRVTGLKPGEKLTEALLDDDEQAEPCLEGVNCITSTGGSPLTAAAMDDLLRVARAGDACAVAKGVRETVRRLREAPPDRA